jgi:hypothetical protein
MEKGKGKRQKGKGKGKGKRQKAGGKGMRGEKGILRSPLIPFPSLNGGWEKNGQKAV